MTRCAIYARFSDAKLQSETSIADQIRSCRLYAEEMGYTVIGIYSDAGISGASAVNRPEMQRLLLGAKNNRFDVVVADALDRISRSIKDTATIHERFHFHDVTLMTVSDGEITDLHVGFKGTMNAVFLKTLAAAVKRSQAARTAEGKVPCGLAYGYDVVREFDGRGQPLRGMRSINEEQASVIRRIFHEYASGSPTRTIAHGLNAERIPSPTGGVWRASTIAGNRSRGSGILWNQAYIGYVVWGRVSMVKHPDTGKRISRPNPPEKWVVAENQALRIVDDATWSAVQVVKSNFCNLSTRKQRRPKRLLSGLVKCGVCGGNMTLVKGGHYGCNTHREAGKSVCTNNRFMKVDRLDKLVLSGIKDKLLDPSRIKEFVREYHRHTKKMLREQAKQAGSLQKELTAVKLKISNLMKLAESGNAPASVLERLNDLELEQNELSKRTNESPETNGVIDFHPGLPEVYKNKIQALENELTQTEKVQQEAAMILRSIIANVVITPGKGRGEQNIELHGAIPELLSLASPAGQSKASEERSKLMVAGGRLELPTSAL